MTIGAYLGRFQSTEVLLDNVMHVFHSPTLPTLFDLVPILQQGASTPALGEGGFLPGLQISGNLQSM